MVTRKMVRRHRAMLQRVVAVEGPQFLTLSPEAMALFALALVWSTDQETGGVLPLDVVTRIRNETPPSVAALAVTYVLSGSGRN